MNATQQEIQAVIDDLSGKIAALETRAAALKDVREYARGLLSKYEPAQFVDKELPCSGIYSERDGQESFKPNNDGRVFFGTLHAPINYADESQYTAADQQAASLVHDAGLDPALVELCGKTTIHADNDGWIKVFGDTCPLSDEFLRVDVKYKEDGGVFTGPAFLWNWLEVVFWRYAK